VNATGKAWLKRNRLKQAATVLSSQALEVLAPSAIPVLPALMYRQRSDAIILRREKRNDNFYH
jgi:hypothetical protein